MSIGAVTDAAGSYSLAGLPAGPRVLSGILRGARTAHVVVEVREQGAVAPDITLVPLTEAPQGAPVIRQGQVRKASAGTYTAVVECRNVDSGYVIVSTPERDDLVQVGAERLAEVPMGEAGAVVRAVSPLGSAAIRIAPPESPAEMSITVRLSGATRARVRVVVAPVETGLPIPESQTDQCAITRPGTFAVGVQCIATEDDAPASVLVTIDSPRAEPSELKIEAIPSRYAASGRELHSADEAFRNVATLVVSPDGTCTVGEPTPVAFQLTWTT
jgi:hypothetical protein